MQKTLIIMVFIAVIFTYVLYFCPTSQITLARDQAGMITDLTGKITVGNKNKKADLLDTLYVGDELKSKVNSKLTVTFFSNGHTETISGSFIVTVGQDSLTIIKSTEKITKKPPSITGVKGVKLRPVQIARGGVQIVRGIWTRALYPATGSIIDEVRPDFKWISENKVPYKYIILRNSSDKDIVIETTLENEKLAIETNTGPKTLIIGKANFPKNLPHLKRNVEYIWCVSDSNRFITIEGNEELVYSFEILKEDDEKSMKEEEARADKLFTENPEDSSPYISLISLYIQQNIYNKALNKAEKIAEKRPDDPNIHKFIAAIYDQMKLKYLAEYMDKKAENIEKR